MDSSFLTVMRKQFENYKSMGEKTFAQVSDEQLLWQYNEDSNSIAIMVKHLWGNMLSRWTDFPDADGEKEWRKRDEEFDNDLSGREEMLSKWEEGWTCLFKALDSLNENDLNKTVTINHKPLTVLEAISRQFAHYTYHIGQIVYIGKMVCGEKWVTLSVPRKKVK